VVAGRVLGLAVGKVSIVSGGLEIGEFILTGRCPMLPQIADQDQSQLTPARLHLK
jgi:hypothetical protein